MYPAKTWFSGTSGYGAPSATNAEAVFAPNSIMDIIFAAAPRFKMY